MRPSTDLIVLSNQLSITRSNSRYPVFLKYIGNYSENCLTLNVVRPVGVFAHAKLPVAVWIYGGGFAEGSTSLSINNLSYFVNASTAMGKPLIAVSMNFRQTFFGLIAGKEILKEGNTNLALRDQRLALAWIQENINAFGGDPKRVTLFGQSSYVPKVSDLMEGERSQLQRR